MRIQIKTQEDRINELYQQIIQLIDEMKRNNSRNNVTEVQKLQKEYWKIIMQRDFSEVSEEKRNELLKYMAEYVPLGMQKGYFGKENILEVLERLTKGITGFVIEDRRSIYGAWKNTGKLALKPSTISERARHVIFHELTHCVIKNFEINHGNQHRHIIGAPAKERNNSIYIFK